MVRMLIMCNFLFYFPAAKVSHRLTLFYVCNDIVQNARRKKLLTLVQQFFTAIKEGAPLVRSVIHDINSYNLL